ncbi:hypothetical protein [Spirosoma jeollabukense]
MSLIKNRPADIVLAFSLIAVSTIPFFKSPIGVFLTIVCIIYLSKNLLDTIKIETSSFLLIIFILEIYHATTFRNYEGWVVRQILLFFFISIFTIYYLKLNFLNIYIRIMYSITLISFAFYFIYLISPSIVIGFAKSMPSLFTKNFIIYDDTYERVNPIIYNFDHNFYKGRNNGPFWEPTVFASLLLIGQIFNLLLNKFIFNKIGIVFSIGILTTLSTTVFIAYFILLVSYFLMDSRFKTVYKTILLFISIFIGSFLFANLSFLEEKINTEFSEIDSNIDKRGDSRMASALLDLSEVTQEDIFLLLGKGSAKYSRIGGTDKDALRNCGVTALLVEWGIPFFLLYVGLLFYSFYTLTKYYQINVLFSFTFTFIILLMSFSEVFLDLPLFHALIFIGLMMKRYYKDKHYIPTNYVVRSEIDIQHQFYNKQLSQ